MLALLAVQSASIRTVVDLDSDWQFARIERPAPKLAPKRQGTAFASQYDITRVDTSAKGGDLSSAELDAIKRAELTQIRQWESATLPHAAWVRPLNDATIWQGVVYYRRHLPTPDAAKRTVLSLQGMQGVDVWLNGHYLASRRGGYLPLRTTIREGGDLLVRVDNRDDPLIPPGKPQHELDFMYGCGLICHASMVSTNPVHIVDALDPDAGPWVEAPTLGASRARTGLHVSVRNDGDGVADCTLRIRIVSPRGTATDFPAFRGIMPRHGRVDYRIPIDVKSPELWSPDHAALYRLRIGLESRGRLVDDVTSRFGLRTVEVSRAKGFVLNGKPIHLIGTNRHQDYPWIGPAMSDAAQYRDALLIKRAGHNIVRLSHYNQSPAFLDACDEIGLMVIPCIPGWQFINRDPRFTARVIRDIHDTVHRDQHHPSVAFYEPSLNETYPPAKTAELWHDAALEAGATLTAGDEGKDVPWEITYNGWREDLTRPSNSDRPGYIREYGDYEFGGATATSRVRFRDGMAKLLNETWNHVWSLNKFRPQYPWTMGEGTWEMFDHNVPWDFAVSASGLADLMRREKPSYWFFASQTSSRPYLKIAADWQPGSDKRTIIVFTNAPSVQLYENGRMIRTAQPSCGPETPYDLSKQFDGTNTAHLLHAPIVFHDVPFALGELKAVGANGGADVVRTAGPPVGLKVWVEDLGVAPRTNDTVFVRAAVVDAHGAVCPGESRDIQFSVTDSGAESLRLSRKVGHVDLSLSLKGEGDAELKLGGKSGAEARAVSGRGQAFQANAGLSRMLRARETDSLGKGEGRGEGCRKSLNVGKRADEGSRPTLVFAGEDHARCEMGIATVLVRTPNRPAAFKIEAAAGALKGSTVIRAANR